MNTETNWYQKGIDAFNAHKNIGQPCEFPFEMDFVQNPETNDYNVEFHNGYLDAEKLYEEQSTNFNQLKDELRIVLNRYNATLYIDGISINEKMLRHFGCVL